VRGGNPPQSGQNSGWPTLSLSTYNAEIIDRELWQHGRTGARNCSMHSSAGPSSLSKSFAGHRRADRPHRRSEASREYNMAQIHVLADRRSAELPGGGRM